MESVFVAPDGRDASRGLSAALRWVSAPPVEAGSVLCLGIRLVGFSAVEWLAARTWLGEAGGASASELARAARFLHVEDAVRHLLARSLLRQVLVRRGAAVLPDVWPVNAWGKPDGAAWGMHFNLSHAGSDVWLACCCGAAVGIDVEEASPALADLLPVLHPAELEDLPGDAGAWRCRRLWVRKEAVIKATGRGLSLPLADFRVALDERAADWLLMAPPDYPEPWTTRDLPVPGSLAVALAVRAREAAVVWRLACVQGRSPGAGEKTPAVRREICCAGPDSRRRPL